MIMGEEMLNETLITMVPTVFEKNNFKGYLSHSQILILFLLFLELKTSPWTQILWEAIIFDTQHDALKVLLKLKNFGKSRNYIWVPPIPEILVWAYVTSFLDKIVCAAQSKTSSGRDSLLKLEMK